MERLKVSIKVVTTNAEGKETVAADVTLSEMKLEDTIKVEKAMLATIDALLGEQKVEE